MNLTPDAASLRDLKTMNQKKTFLRQEWVGRPRPLVQRLNLPSSNDQGTVKSLTTVKTQALKPLASPRVYRPQPTPKVLQTKSANLLGLVTPRVVSPREVAQLSPTRGPLLPQPQRPTAFVTKPKSRGIGLELRSQSTPQTLAALLRPARPQAAVQMTRRGVVQATKFYPNLHPGAVESIDSSNIFRLDSFADQYRLHKVNSHGVNVPNQQYNFVRTSQGEMLLHSRYRHPSIAEGKQVLYAGEIFFNNGRLQWWSNGSGHYQPDQDSAEQANLPMDCFYSYQQIIKGEHTRKKG